MADQLRRLHTWPSRGPCSALRRAELDGCVRDWLGEQSDAFRRRIEIVVIDPSAPYASGIRAALPEVKIAVDKWHLIALANTMVTEVRQTVADPIWVNRRLLLTSAEHIALTHEVTNARTEGFNRIIKQVKRVGCSYRNMINYHRRILCHIAVNRPQRSAA